MKMDSRPVMKLEWILDFPIPFTLTSLMQAAADQTIRSEGIQLPCCASIHICDDHTIQNLNREYRHLDQATDVLSFPSTQWTEGKTAGLQQNRLKKSYDEVYGACFLGDVVLSIDHIKEQAAAFGHSEAREACYLLVHSLLHLMGYDHMESEERKKMREKEEEILQTIGIGREGEAVKVNDQILLDMARDAMSRSYSPYSHYPVGAALLCKDGRIFTGCNIENASFGCTICAERTAMVKAVSEGALEFEKIAIATRETPGWPCGICRQFMSEFAPNLQVIVTWQDGQFTESSSLDSLLPHQFDLKGNNA